MINGHRLHHSMARGSPIPRLMINMLAPKAHGAMAAAGAMLERLHLLPAMLACK